MVAAHLTACVVEPVLSSLAGGGFLLARTSDGQNRLYDFFVQTPIQRCCAQDTNFYPISADFGITQQEFHIGPGSIATPGTVKGLFAIQQELCKLPMIRLAEPAIEIANTGIAMNAFQAYIFDIVKAIFLSSADTRKIYGSRQQNGQLLQEGEFLKQPELADCLDSLAREGESLFYRGEIGQTISQLCMDNGGHLTRADLQSYQLKKRNPLAISYRETSILTNPAPSLGGTLIAFALKLLEEFELSRYRWGHTDFLGLLTQILKVTNKARIDADLDGTVQSSSKHVLDPAYLADYKAQIMEGAVCTRGTTHISIIDQHGNIASLTTSNGEGCGSFIPGTGIMLNNMLGEEDLNPQGFHHWPRNQRMTSMMAPSILMLPDGTNIALGSGGSNRLRTAILQVLINLIDFNMTLDEAVTRPRIHYELDHLSIEPGFDPDELMSYVKYYPNHKCWETINLFFGGVHSVSAGPTGFSGIGDPRRGGSAIVIL